MPWVSATAGSRRRTELGGSASERLCDGAGPAHRSWPVRRYGYAGVAAAHPVNGYLVGTGFFGDVACIGTRDVGLFWSAALDWPLAWDRNQETAVQSRTEIDRLVSLGATILSIGDDGSAELADVDLGGPRVSRASEKAGRLDGRDEQRLQGLRRPHGGIGPTRRPPGRLGQTDRPRPSSGRRPMKVRCRWSELTGEAAGWGQVCSFDDGRTWTPNWYMWFTRLSH